MKERKKLVVVGLGYIGLPTAVVLAENGWNVTGIDIDAHIVDSINDGRTPFTEVELGAHLARVVDKGFLQARTDIVHAPVYIIAVPTPFTSEHQANLSHIDAAAASIAPILQGGELLILESTSPVGTTERFAQSIISARPGLSLDGADGTAIIHVAHAPERVMPGRIMEEMPTNDRVIGGLTKEATALAKSVYATFCEGEIFETNARTAELVKLAENSYRDVNIVFANELSLICDEHGINVWELIKLANHHPRVSILSPGPGVGGHCIAVDPWFVVADSPSTSRLIRTARKVNDSKPEWVLKKFADIAPTLPDNATVALMGLSFKANVDDVRESPALLIAEQLAKAYPHIHFRAIEPNIDSLPVPVDTYANCSHTPNAHAIADCDAAILLVAHRQFRHAREYLRSDTPYIDSVGMWA